MRQDHSSQKTHGLVVEIDIQIETKTEKKGENNNKL